MKKANTKKKYILLGVLIIILVAIAVIHYEQAGNNSLANEQAIAGAVLTSNGENSVAAQTTSSVGIVPSPTITIHLLTPTSNSVWKIGQPNPIAWDNAAGITGEIDLVNATTKQFIGVILSDINANQISYIWDAREIYLARYSADEKDVVPGTYSIRIHFDGNGLTDLISGPITIN